MSPTPSSLQHLHALISILPHLILPCLNRADIINLQVAGVPLNLSRTIQTQYLGAQCDVVLHPYCKFDDLGYPMEPEPPVFCPSGSMSQKIRIGSCAGLIADPSPSETKPKGNHSDDGSKPPTYAPHTSTFQICQTCFDRNREREWRSETAAIRSFRQGLCREHSEENAPKPLASEQICSCYAKLNIWRCAYCRKQSIIFLKRLASGRRRSLRHSQPKEDVVVKKRPKRPATSICAILGCGKPAWRTLATKKAVKGAVLMCLVCCAMMRREVPCLRLRGVRGEFRRRRGGEL